MKIFLALSFLVLSPASFAHKPNEAYFIITQSDDTAEVIAEFPWTLRNALLEFSPSLEKANGKSEFEAVFIEYIKSNFILTGLYGENFEFIEFKEVPNNGHSHQGKYSLIFRGKNLVSISNTLLFNIYDNQKNHHKITINNIEDTFETTLGNETFEIKKTANSSFKFWWIVLMFLPIIYFVVKSKRKQIEIVSSNMLIVFFMSIGLYSCSNEDVTNTEVNISVESEKPNILLIIADDMGLDATPGYNIGSVKPNMPNLQEMINEGIRFNNVWANPVCTPTRGTILTGKYGFRTNVLKVDDAMATSEVSIQSQLDNQNSGYSHGVIGKWHLSRNSSHPNNMGVDYFAGHLSGGVQSYWNWNLTENGVTTSSSEYTTTKLTDLAINWVEEQTQPWFLWVAYNAPHTPFHLPPDELHYQGNLPLDQASIDANPLPYYLAMLEAMDTEMGRLINTMTEEEKNNTVVIFIGDNGTPNQVVQQYASNRAKGSLYQGGINVPMIVSGKGVSRFNTSENALVNATDLYATIAEIAGLSINEINDSKSFKELLTDADGEKRKYIYSEIGKETGGSDYTIRNVSHKYIKFDNGNEGLYNLSATYIEGTNLLNANQLPLSSSDEEILNELVSKLDEIRQ